VLGRASLKERAHEIGLSDSLRALVEHSDETLGRQINYILQQLEAVAVEEDARSDDGGAEGEEEEDAEEEEDELEDDEVDLFVETPLPTEPTGGTSGEELLCSRYIAGVAAAQHEAEQLRASQESHDAERRRSATAVTATSSEGGPPNAPPARKHHSADEPLQRPSTPSQRSVGGAASGAAGGTAGGTARLLSSKTLSVVAEDSATCGEATELTAVEPGVEEPAGETQEAPFTMRSKIPRTPQVKTRSSPGAVPLQPPSGGSTRKPAVPKKGAKAPLPQRS